MKAIFFQVHTAQDKIARIIEAARFHFLKKEHLLFFVEDDRALRYIDDLLWSTPRESFLPHKILSTPEKELIGITKEKLNLNESKIAFNLCLTPLLLDIPHVYDFEDTSSPNKQMLSQIRFSAYKSAHFFIESRTTLES